MKTDVSGIKILENTNIKSLSEITLRRYCQHKKQPIWKTTISMENKWIKELVNLLLSKGITVMKKHIPKCPE